MKALKFLTKYKWYRKLIGGIWYKHAVPGPRSKEFWSKKKHFKHYTLIIKLEYYRR
jgi:hypothetical protein